MKIGRVALDGTKIKANASKHKAMSYDRMQEKEKQLRAEVKQLLAQAEAADAEEDDRYGKEMYALYSPTANRAGTEAALTAFLDLLFEERGYQPIASSLASYQSIRARWFNHLMPTVDQSEVAEQSARFH